MAPSRPGAHVGLAGRRDQGARRGWAVGRHVARLLQDVDLAGAVRRHEDAALAVHGETDGPEAVARTLGEIRVGEDVARGCGAGRRVDRLAVFERDDRQLVANWLVAVPWCCRRRSAGLTAGFLCSDEGFWGR